MIKWYSDNEYGIFFSIKPEISIKYANFEMTKKEKQEINKTPFVNLKDVYVELNDYISEKYYNFTIPSQYSWDGATIPKVFWRCIGSKTESRFLIPSLIHDFLCENHELVDNNRYFADKIFERLLYVSGVPSFSRWLMFHSVDNFQKLMGW